MKFSVVINNYNYGRYVVDAILSVHAQSLAPFEIIVVDDGSTDDSCKRIAELQERMPNLHLHTQTNSGQLSTMRKGIGLATGDWCFFLDADDQWTPGHLAAAADIIKAHPEVSLYFSGHRETSGPPLFRTTWPEGITGPLVGLVAVTKTRVGTITSTIGLRRDIAFLALDFDPALDVDWRIRADDCLLYGAWLAGAVGYHNPAQTALYRIHGGNAFAHADRTQIKALYRANKTRLFQVLLARFSVRPEICLELLSTELSSVPRRRRHLEMRRLYRRATRHVQGNRLRKLMLFLRSFC